MLDSTYNMALKLLESISCHIQLWISLRTLEYDQWLSWLTFLA